MISTILIAAIPLLASAQYTATYSVGDLPSSSQQGQSGTNQCGTTASQSSECQNVFVNSVNDFCLWGPPSTHSDEGDGSSSIGNVEQIVVSYCLNDGYGTRLIPQGALTAAHFVKVVSDEVSYVQVTGTGDFTQILIPAGDEGGELDPHSWTGLGNPQGGLVFTDAFSGEFEQTHEWTSFMSATDFCIRACQDGPNAPGYCQHIYDVLSCSFTVPGSEDPGFDDCLGDPAEEPGVYSGSTFHQGDPTTPAPHAPGPTSQCTTYSNVGGSSVNVGNIVAAITGSTTSSAMTTSITTTTSANNSTMSSSSMTSIMMNSTTSSGMTTSRITQAPSGSSSASASVSSAAASSVSAKSGAESAILPVSKWASIGMGVFAMGLGVMLI